MKLERTWYCQSAYTSANGQSDNRPHYYCYFLQWPIHQYFKRHVNGCSHSMITYTLFFGGIRYIELHFFFFLVSVLNIFNHFRSFPARNHSGRPTKCRKDVTFISTYGWRIHAGVSLLNFWMNYQFTHSNFYLFIFFIDQSQP